MAGRSVLFRDSDWSAVRENVQRAMTAEIDQIDRNRLLNSSPEDLSEYFRAKYEIEVPVLQEDKIVADQREATIDVSRNPMRDVRDRSRPFYVAGTQIDVTVPFVGDREVFGIRPTTYYSNALSAEVQNNNVVIRISGSQLTEHEVRDHVQGTLAEIRQYLEWLRKDVGELNGLLSKIARQHLERRRQKLLEDQKLVASLGFPLKERPDAPKTYAAPEVRRRITPAMPPASAAPYKPEPILSNEDYDHILRVMQNMAVVMERSPSAFVSMDEEALRSHFLVQLNAQYEGQATGETFNYEGKTDILVRAQGKNIFIAECKYWTGPKKLADTVDQILGYATWRDTKIAVVIFNQNKSFSQVLTTIPEVLRAHPNFKRDLPRPSETNFRCVMAHRDDPNREMTLTVMAFDVPKSSP